MGKRSIRERGDAEAHLGERCSERPGGSFRALEPFRRPGIPPGEHRAGDVEDDDRLGVGSRLERSRPLDHRLCRGEPEEHPRGDDCQDRGNEAARARVREAEHLS